MTTVMAYLNGNHVPNLLRTRTLITKFLGTVCSVSAGFPMGPEGPMVHCGACLASIITYAEWGKCSELYPLQRSWEAYPQQMVVAFLLLTGSLCSQSKEYIM